MGRSGEALHKVVPNPPPPYTTHSTEIARKRQTLIRLHVKNKAMKEAAQANGLHMLFPASGHRQVKTNYSGNNCKWKIGKNDSCTLSFQHIASVFRNYYPEGGWGYVILACAFLSVFIVEGLQQFTSFAFVHLSLRFVVRDPTSVSGRTNQSFTLRRNYSIIHLFE